LSPPHVYLRYAELVRAYSDKLDLVSPGDLDRFEERHIRDSLRARPWINRCPPGIAVDVGSGAGLPGIPLAIADPRRKWRLLEPRHRRAAFLEEIVRDLDLSNVEVRVQTAEEAAAELGPVHAVAIARALAPPAAAVEMLTPLIVPRGTIFLFIGRQEAATKYEEVEPGLVRVTV
jgi:16S rRNA (guanine527-N7)-methyltransferase